MSGDIDLQVCYEEGYAKFGRGAIVILDAGIWRYESIPQLGRFRRVKLEESFVSSPVTTQSTTLLDLIDEVAPDYYVMVREIHPPPWVRRLFSRILRQLRLEERQLIVRVIPQINLEHQDQDSKITGTNDFSTEGNEEHTSQYGAKWQYWLEEVDQLEPQPSKNELNEYGKALIEKYKQQGLEL